MKAWFLRHKKITIPIVIMLIVGVLFYYPQYKKLSNVEDYKISSHYTYVDIEQFKQFVDSKDLLSFTYDLDTGSITGRLDTQAMLKYGISGSGMIVLGNVDKLIAEGKLTNKVVLNKIDADINRRIQEPFGGYLVFCFIFAFGIVMFKTIRGTGGDNQSDIHMPITTVNNSQGGTSGTSSLGGKANTVVDVQKPGVRLSDVKGHDEIKADIEFIIKMLKNPEKYEKLGAKVPKGVMFFGPPGTGKTMLAKAIANEVDIPFIATGGSDFVEKYVGVGAQRVRDIFKEAKKHPKAIIYIDEVDAVGKKRDGNDNDERTSTLNALLMEMDGFKESQNILVIASTNRLDILDDALLRPGRFDKHIAINPPDLKGRLDILKLYAKNKKLDKDVSLESLAAMTRGFSGADLSNVLNEAAMLTAFRDKHKTSMQEISDAFDKIVTKGNKKENYDRSVDDTILTAWHEAGHAIVSKLLSKQKVNKVTIAPTTSGAGGYTLMEPKEGSYMSKEDLENMVQTNYGGRAAELILLKDENKVTTGASKDIEQSTNILVSMLSKYGMSKKFGLLNLSMIQGFNTSVLVEEAKEWSNTLYQNTVDFLTANYDLLKEMADRLVKEETLLEDDLEKLFAKYSTESNIIIPDFSSEPEVESNTKRNRKSKRVAKSAV